MELSQMAVFAVSFLNFLAAGFALRTAFENRSLAEAWQSKWQLENDRMEYIYRSTFTSVDFEAFVGHVSQAREKANGSFARFRSSLRGRIDFYKVGS